MTSIAFDTHAAANRFKRAGFTEDQVEALVEVARETTALPDISTLATKSDIEQLQFATKTDIEQLRLATKTDIEQLRLGTKTDIEQLRVETKADIGVLRSDIEQLRLTTKTEFEKQTEVTKAEIAKLEAKISDAQFKSVGAIITAMAIIVGLGATLPKLLLG
jgi:hypothetical protein